MSTIIRAHITHIGPAIAAAKATVLSSLPLPSFEPKKKKNVHVEHKLKDGAYFRYCAYVLRIFPMTGLCPLTNKIFLCGLKLSRESRT